MKNKNLRFMGIITIVIIVLMFAFAMFKIKGNLALIKSDIFITPFVTLGIYFLLTFFIKNPQFLVKKTLAEIENPNLNQNKAIEKWKTIFYYLRFFIVLRACLNFIQ